MSSKSPRFESQDAEHGPSHVRVQPSRSASDNYPPPSPPLRSVTIYPPPPPNPSSEFVQQVSPTRSHAHSSTKRRRTLKTPPASPLEALRSGGQRRNDSTASVVGQGFPDNIPTQQPGPHPKNSATTIDQATAFWEAYNNAGDIEDKEFVRSSGGDLDVLLIFAGLFSAIDTAFIIESYKNLKSDPADEATKLLRSVVLILHNSTYTDDIIDPPPFAASPRDIRINALFFTSLCCSLSAAFGAVLAKQWLTQYDQEGGGSLKTPAARGRERQRKYEGRSQWRLEDVVTTLPTFLQFSLFFFLVGLADFTWPLNTPVAPIIISFTAATFIFYAITITISVVDPSSPFQTRLSTLLLRMAQSLQNSLLFPIFSIFPSIWLRVVKIPPNLVRRIAQDLRRPPIWLLPLSIPIFFIKYTILPLTEGVPRLYKSTRTLYRRTVRSISNRWSQSKQAVAPIQSLESRCVIYLLERMTMPENLVMLAEAMEFLPDDEPGVPQITEKLIAFHLKPLPLISPPVSWSFPGLHGASGKAMMKMVGVLVGKWKYFELNSPTTDSFTLEPSLNNKYFRVCLISAVWDAFLANAGDRATYEATRRIFLALSLCEGDPMSTFEPIFLPSRSNILVNLTKDDDPIVQEHTLHLLSLLPGMGCDTLDTRQQLGHAAVRSAQLLNALHTTMLTAPGKESSLESFWMATFRVDILPLRRLDGLLDSRFAEYFANWFMGSVDPHWRDSVPNEYSFHHRRSKIKQAHLYWIYLLRLFHLVKVDQTWCHKLTCNEHARCLRIILQDFPSEFLFCGAPIALYSFLCLWRQEELKGEASQSRGFLLTSDLVQVVASSMASHKFSVAEILFAFSQYSGNLNPEIAPEAAETATRLSRPQLMHDMGEMLEWFLSYLSAAKRGGLIHQASTSSTIAAYTSWCEFVGQELETSKYIELSSQLRTVLADDDTP